MKVVVVMMVVVAVMGNNQMVKLYKKVSWDIAHWTHEFAAHSKILCGAACSQTDYCEGFNFHQAEKFCRLLNREAPFHAIKEEPNDNDGFTAYWTDDQLRFTPKNLKAYKFPDRREAHENASILCRFLGGRLLLPKSENEQLEAVEFISEVGASSLWIGATDMNHDLVYVDMETNMNLTYYNWDQKYEPNYPDKEECVYVSNEGPSKTGKWYNHYCTGKRHFVCEATMNH